MDRDELRESEERLRLALECGRMGVWDWDVLNDVVTWSEETYRLFGLPGTDPAGNLIDVHSHLVDEDRAAVLARVQEALQEGSGDLYEVEFRLRNGAGEVRWAEGRGRVIRDASGRAVRMTGVVSDITDRKEREAEMARMRERAEAAARAKSEFLANMSHEIRTPLHAVIGMAGLLEQSELGPEQKECVETIRAGANHLLSLVDEVLDFSKIEAGRVELSREAFSPSECLREVVSLLAPRAGAKGLELRTTFAPDVPRRVEGDPARLRQVLVNLIGNAIKFTPRGSVSVSLRRDEDGRGRAGLSFEVADTGIGIPEEVLPRLFDAFEQGDASLTRRYGGTGLGLAISKRLVELMGGTMRAARRESGGSVFRFFVPLPAVAAEGVRAPAAPSAPLRTDLRVLLVEDNQINRIVALRMIERLGLSAETACTGAEAVLACAQSTFDVVFMDVQMPVMGGIEAARRIREAGRGRPPWIVALTANAFAENERACREAGMNDFLSKPFTLEKLAETLRRATAGLSAAS